MCMGSLAELFHYLLSTMKSQIYSLRGAVERRIVVIAIKRNAALARYRVWLLTGIPVMGLTLIIFISISPSSRSQLLWTECVIDVYLHSTKLVTLR
jgi:hypothetical protein